jgi:ubiquinone/menaquinone biosynthesis C-methylase UbiE
MGLEHVMKVIGDYWDDRSSEFDKEHDTEDIQAWEAALSELLGKDVHKNIVDLGTGTGFLANMTARLGYPTVGVDLSREMMKYAVRHGKREGSGAVYMEGSALELPFMENSVDYIINARLIWTLVEPAQALKEWFRVIRPGGKVMCFNRMQEGVGLTVWKDDIYQDQETDRSLKIMSAGMEELKGLLEESGFTEVEIKKLPGLTRPEFDYEPWFVLMGTKPVTKRQWEEEGMADFWDKSAAAYEADHEVADKETWKKRLEELVGEKRDIHILDVATGTGIIANMLGTMGYERVLGVDISEQMMRIALEHAQEQENQNVAFKYANALELPFEDETFDVVISSRLLWTLTEPEAAVKEWRRVLKPGGRLIAINELEPGDGIRCGEMSQYQEEIKAQELPYGNVAQDEIIRLMEETGLTEVKLSPMPGCHLLNSDRENWYAFTGEKNNI